MGTNDEATRGSHEPLALEVSIAGGAEAIRVEVDRSGLLISTGARWRKPLTPEEAWRVAEPPAPVATRAPAPYSHSPHARPSTPLSQPWCLVRPVLPAPVSSLLFFLPTFRQENRFRYFVGHVPCRTALYSTFAGCVSQPCESG